MTTKKPRGLAAMSPEKRREICSMGGKAVSKNRDFMREIGSKGGKSVSKDKSHMAKIGAMGGSAPTKPKET